jgi:hypothetical protein
VALVAAAAGPAVWAVGRARRGYYRPAAADAACLMQAATAAG